MPAGTDLIARSGDLKQQLVAFSKRPRYRSAFRRATKQRFGSPVIRGDEEDVVNFIDAFVLQYKLSDGRTVLDHFVDARSNLTNRERDMLLGWHDVVEGIFEVQRRDGDGVVAVNLIDELVYRVYSNMGPSVFAQMPPGSFAITRLVPVCDVWALSGATHVQPASERATMYRIAADAALRHPAKVFRNPDKLTRAWELQRRHRDSFIEFFGADLVVLPGSQLADRMNNFTEYHSRKAAYAAGRTVWSTPQFDLPAQLQEADTVAVIYDATDGLNFCADFGLVEAAFADPERNADSEHGQAVLGYLDDDSISPLPFRRLAQRHPTGASRLFQTLLGRPGFCWEQDGEALLRERKPGDFIKPALPSVVALSDGLAEHVSPDRPSRPTPRRMNPAVRT